MTGHIVLIGLSGSGKSAVGRLLADELSCPLYDTDVMLAARTGVSVPALLKAGEARFRRLEEEVVAEACGSAPGVIATGGGATLSAHNHSILRQTGYVVWLQAPIAALVTRLRVGEERPLLAGDPAARLTRLRDARAPLYMDCAHVVVDTDGLTPVETARRVLEACDAASVKTGGRRGG